MFLTCTIVKVRLRMSCAYYLSLAIILLKVYITMRVSTSSWESVITPSPSNRYRIELCSTARSTNSILHHSHLLLSIWCVLSLVIYCQDLVIDSSSGSNRRGGDIIVSKRGRKRRPIIIWHINFFLKNYENLMFFRNGCLLYLKYNYHNRFWSEFICFYIFNRTLT